VLIGCQGGRIPGVGDHPHAITAAFPGERLKALDKGATKPASPEGFFNAQLVKEHLCSLVWVGHLDSAHEAHRAALLVSNQEVMAFIFEKPPGRSVIGWTVEQMRSCYNSILVAMAKQPDLHRSSLPRSAMAATGDHRGKVSWLASPISGGRDWPADAEPRRLQY